MICLVACVLALVPVLIDSTQYHGLHYFHCRNLGVRCVSDDAFVYCAKYSYIVLKQRNILYCPEGYTCQENSQYPCARNPELDSTPNGCIQTSSTTVKTSTTTNEPYTTGRITTIESQDAVGYEQRLVLPESRIDENVTADSIETTEDENIVLDTDKEAKLECDGSTRYLPGATCSQYIDCQKYYWFWSHPVEKNCDEGESFSIVESRCVPRSEGECTD